MQYILTEEEMAQHRAKINEADLMLRYLPSPNVLQETCSKIANEWAVWTGWDGKQEPTTWDCVLTVEYEHYCDKCPVQTICPNPHKEWSK